MISAKEPRELDPMVLDEPGEGKEIQLENRGDSKMWWNGSTARQGKGRRTVHLERSKNNCGGAGASICEEGRTIGRCTLVVNTTKKLMSGWKRRGLRPDGRTGGRVGRCLVRCDRNLWVQGWQLSWHLWVRNSASNNTYVFVHALLLFFARCVFRWTTLHAS